MNTTEEFLSKLQGFFDEKETYLGCEKSIQEMQQQMAVSMEHMERLQKEVREATELPYHFWKSLLSWFIFWK